VEGVVIHLDLRDEVERLRERVQDYEDDARTVLAERCAPDERHCSCVPHLRREVERLRAEVEQLQQDAAVAASTVSSVSTELERLREQRHDDGKGRRVDAYLAGALDERAAVVAWMREEAEPSPQSFTVRGKEWAKRIDDAADYIERGEHREEEP
jgi:cell division septum initiation protein DivIVA